MSKSLITSYSNGNTMISIYSDGTRIIDYEDNLDLEFPLNIDIKVSDQCSFGLNPTTGKSFCDFCHESATTNGVECDYEDLKLKLDQLPKGIELAVGCNYLTPDLYKFILWCNHKVFIVNLTVNQGHLHRDLNRLNNVIEYNLVRGVGVSYRPSLKWNIPATILNYSNTVFHVIVGIDSIDDILSLADRGVRKVLVLGEKNFGFNVGKVDTSSRSHREWFWWISKLFKTFEVVSFDNLALEQLNIKRFFTDRDWSIFNQGEHSFYIDSVKQQYAPSSRDPLRVDWNLFSIPEYFKNKI